MLWSKIGDNFKWEKHLFSLFFSSSLLNSIMNAWTTALKKAGVKYRVPYTMRHTFAVWSLALDMHPNRLVKLMGHGSKKMVYEVYGNYVDDLETEVGKIRCCFSNDFK